MATVRPYMLLGLKHSSVITCYSLIISLPDLRCHTHDTRPWTLSVPGYCTSQDAYATIIASTGPCLEVPAYRKTARYNATSEGVWGNSIVVCAISLQGSPWRFMYGGN